MQAPVLASLAAGIGLAPNAYAEAVEATPVGEHMAATRRLMDRAGLRSFPGFLVERATGLVRVDHEPFDSRPSGFVDAVRASAAG